MEITIETTLTMDCEFEDIPGEKETGPTDACGGTPATGDDAELVHAWITVGGKRIDISAALSHETVEEIKDAYIEGLR